MGVCISQCKIFDNKEDSNELITCVPTSSPLAHEISLSE